MNYIKYKGKTYSTRTFEVYLADETEDESETITVASTLLEEAIADKMEVTDSEEERIDNQIYFYLDYNDLINADAHKICSELLDEPYVLVQEIE